MGRYSDKKLPKKTQDELWDEFCDLVVSLHSRDAVRSFFCDLLNRPERLMLARRLHVAALLESGYTYREIQSTLGAGTQLIARVERWLEFGRGGYKKAVREYKKKGGSEIRQHIRKFYVK